MCALFLQLHKIAVLLACSLCAMASHCLCVILRALTSLQCPCRPESNITDILAVNIGCELLKIVPGRVRLAHLVVWRLAGSLDISRINFLHK